MPFGAIVVCAGSRNTYSGSILPHKFVTRQLQDMLILYAPYAFFKAISGAFVETPPIVRLMSGFRISRRRFERRAYERGCHDPHEDGNER